MDVIIVTDIERAQSGSDGFLNCLKKAFNKRGVVHRMASYDGREYDWITEAPQHAVGVVVADMRALSGGITPLQLLVSSVRNVPVLAISDGSILADAENMAKNAGAKDFMLIEKGAIQIAEKALKIAQQPPTTPAP
ncbi:MAG TPA: hypothetical protein PK513_08500 [Alphaproteobacteria bacterium]|nr:hypothetical protein [Alphaproteobacteria bacterium]USO04690.1 MAG: hypothetical protein H6859_05840 [Rhodospirillales bacterium]HOO82528.1 hypothetical protein [Alphaproteobacteria bacterium]